MEIGLLTDHYGASLVLLLCLAVYLPVAVAAAADQSTDHFGYGEFACFVMSVAVVAL